MDSSKPSLGEDIYSGTASFGRFIHLASAIIVTIIGGAFIIYCAKILLGPNIIVNPKNPDQITKQKAGSFIIFSLIFIGIAWLSYYIALQFKFYAAASGVGEIFSLIK